MIEVRTGDARDIAAIMPVMENAFDPVFGEAWTAAQCLSTLILPGAQLLVATLKNEITGFTLSRWVCNEEELLLIGVLPSARRSGVGRQLIETLLQNSFNAGRNVVFLEVREGNTAEYFYSKIGFQPVGRRPSYYKAHNGNHWDAITMALKVQQ